MFGLLGHLSVAALGCGGDGQGSPETGDAVVVDIEEGEDLEPRRDTEVATDDTVSDTAETSRDSTPVLCTTTAPTACPSPAPTYVADIEPIMQSRCVGCHYGEIGGPWPLTSYGHVTDWRDTIRAAMLDCSMPPPEEEVAMPLSERQRILEWIRCGMPRL